MAAPVYLSCRDRCSNQSIAGTHPSSGNGQYVAFARRITCPLKPSFCADLNDFLAMEIVYRLHAFDKAISLPAGILELLSPELLLDLHRHPRHAAKFCRTIFEGEVRLTLGRTICPRHNITRARDVVKFAKLTISANPRDKPICEIGAQVPNGIWSPRWLDSCSYAGSLPVCPNQHVVGAGHAIGEMDGDRMLVLLGVFNTLVDHEFANILVTL